MHPTVTKLNTDLLNINAEVQQALAHQKPVVALESTIISHGMPYPQNVETAFRVEETVRKGGAVPATIAIRNGRLCVGMTADEIDYLGKADTDVIKTSRRDIPFIVSTKRDGATTVAATMIVAGLAGIEFMATGGIGGVHRGVEETMDVSADLEELARTNIAVVCAGVKSILDIGRTLEYLETLGVPVVGYQTDTVPAFYARSSGFSVDYRADDAQTVAKALHVKFSLGLDGAMLITNPVPEAFALNPQEIDATIEQALDEMNRRGITGKDTTPFLLARIADQTAGSSLTTNIELVINNARVAADIAIAYSHLD
jgi:pseudouridine-5'-phosphate glycosidase